MLTGNALTSRVIGLAIEVHRQFGPGLMESAYERCLCFELRQAGIEHERQVTLPAIYKGAQIDTAFRLDLLVQRELILELKCVDRLLPLHEAQLLTYLRLSGLHIGLLLNFNVMRLKDGVRRLVLSEPPRVATSTPNDCRRIPP